MSQRFNIRIGSLYAPLLALFGGTPRRSFVELDGDKLRFKFGWLFDYTFPVSDVQSVYRRHWPWYMGVGWRGDLRGLIGLIGSYQDVVEVRFARKHKIYKIVPWVSCDRLAVSLEQPQAFIESMTQSR